VWATARWQPEWGDVAQPSPPFPPQPPEVPAGKAEKGAVVVLYSEMHRLRIDVRR